MSSTSIPALLYYYGRIVDGEDHCCYVCTPPYYPQPFQISRGTSVCQLKQSVQYHLNEGPNKIIKQNDFRFPIAYISGCFVYIKCRISRDEDIDALFNVRETNSKLESVELFVTLDNEEMSSWQVFDMLA